MTGTITDHRLSSAFLTPPPRRLLRPQQNLNSSRSLSPSFPGPRYEENEKDESSGPSRPPVRPTGPSKHHLEPNPFEQSFSSKPSDGQSASPESNPSVKSRRKGGNKAGKADIKTEEEGDEHVDKAADDATRGNEPLTPSAATQTPSKRILPPVSSIVSPAPHEANRLEYPWSSAMAGSLRSGPLSPAMLAGPQSTFDVSNFRSGFTPDLSNFKTGLTPLGSSGSGFPPPSPNTAAFLAMVTNSSAPGITPNTLSALSGNPMDAHANGQALISSHPGNNGKSHHHHNGEHHDQFDFAFGRSMQDTPSKQGSKLRMSTIGSDGRDGSADFADSKTANQKRGVPNQQRQQQQTTQAASGLFLLSQAHQELSKREDAAAAAAAITHPTYTGQQLYSGGNGPKSTDGKAAKGTNNKRKKSTEPGAAQKPAAVKKVKAAGAGKMDDFTMEEMGYESDEIDDEGNRKAKSSNGEGGDDEDKRKSFLERNRQAALKCRQRKKAWLASLQAKVEYLQSDNENLQGTCSALRNEVMFLKSQLMQAQRLSGEGGSTVPTASIARNSISGPEQNNAMTAAVANRIGATPGQYQAHAVPRPTHIPGQPSAQPYSTHPHQGSAQAA